MLSDRSKLAAMTDSYNAIVLKEVKMFSQKYSLECLYLIMTSQK